MQTNESLVKQYGIVKAMGRYDNGKYRAGKIVKRLRKRIRSRIRFGSLK